MTEKQYTNPDILVETNWLEDHIDDPDLRIVDCDPYDMYRRAHIKNAIGIRTHNYIKHPDYSKDPYKNPLVAAPDVFEELMSSMGISNDSLVVAYDNAGSLYSTRFWWVLNFYGHSNVRVLNGGCRKWLDEGRPMSSEIESPPKTTFIANAVPDLICEISHGLSQVGSEDTIFLDLRSDGEWNGSNSRGNQHTGHIPGSIHLEWLNFITSDKYRTFKSAAELTSMLLAKGITKEKKVITY